MDKGIILLVALVVCGLLIAWFGRKQPPQR